MANIINVRHVRFVGTPAAIANTVRELANIGGNRATIVNITNSRFKIIQTKGRNRTTKRRKRTKKAK